MSVDINIAFAVSDNYVEHLEVAIYSILKSNADNNFNFFILSQDISSSSKNRILDISKKIKKFNVEFILPKDDFEDMPITIGHISKETYFRYCLADILPRIDKIIYLDCDLLVLNNLNDFWSTDLKDNYIAGVIETDNLVRFPKHKKSIGLSKKDPYINAGVLLMNLKKIRKDNLSKKFFEITDKQRDIIKFQDQDVINIVCKDRILPIDLIYNYTDQNRLDNERELSDIVIEHYNGDKKPWEKIKFEDYQQESVDRYSLIRNQYLEDMGIKNNNIVLSVKEVSKSFRLPTEQANGVKQVFVNWAKGVKGYKKYEVLKDISFNVEKGDFFGILGRNGSGKSTLLKIISQIYIPESGNVEVKGRLIPFIELGVGFNPELTGRENVYMNGALLGFSKEEVSAMYDEIVEFAELEEFMDQKLKNYSSGMQVRLAFSVAIKAQGDILVLDEVLAVGDEAFQQKCDNFFSEIKKDKSKTVILVTHSMSSVRKYCNKAVLIEDGRIVVDGSRDDAINGYIESNFSKENKESNIINDDVPEFNISPIDGSIVQSSEGFNFIVKYNYRGGCDAELFFAMFDVDRGGVTLNSKGYKVKKGNNDLRIHLPLDIFNSGRFKISASIRKYGVKGDEGLISYTNDDNSCIFVIENKNQVSDYPLIDINKIDIREIK